MVKYRYKFYYTNNTSKVKDFDTTEEATWYAHMEGDHLLEYFYVGPVPIKRPEFNDPDD